ncbi:MAG: FlgB family protein [Pseudomonadota bacterium]
MFDQLELLRLADAMARHASDRQSVIAKNVANADTPGYRSRDLPDFSQIYAASSSDEMRATRGGHLIETGSQKLDASAIDAPGGTSPNGNTVSLEVEMVRAAEVRQSHDMAVGVYSASLDMLRSALGRR